MKKLGLFAASVAAVSATAISASSSSSSFSCNTNFEPSTKFILVLFSPEFYPVLLPGK
ncbi:hypothetical protein SLEP1_g44784 [Rubroshorea leprosula]|uniref:Uncharacterized protein n=1 Tax=Rubroshorea leprosula TaxID=152421 RepID=A0AAV5LH53_9ROSI|nr:hypothetical protein SLEP1_g44784 [Rubroshorea leprosula]